MLSVGRYPCSSLGWFKNTVLASYGSGHLRLYSADTGGLHVEATAHGKWITAVDVAENNGLVSVDTPLPCCALAKYLVSVVPRYCAHAAAYVTSVM